MAKASSKTIVNVGLFGLGTVGAGVVRILRAKHAMILERTGLDFRIKSVCVRSPKKKRASFLKNLSITSDPRVILNDSEIDQVVELIGGTTTAFGILKQALQGCKDAISANKALFAEKGKALYRLSNSTGRHIGLEAAVGGGIPVIRGLKQGLVANRVSEIHGILNGTCNYILTEMQRSGRAYGDVLVEAQKLGYAEANPKMDVSGADTAHKLAILARLAFNREVHYNDVTAEGIEGITAEDIQYASELGYTIKLLGIAKLAAGALELRVYPALLESRHTLANVNGVNNGILIRGDEVGDVLFYGRGAGQEPTASAVVSDMIHIALQRRSGMDAREAVLSRAKVQDAEKIQSRFYLRFRVVDTPGVMGFLTQELGRAGVSLSSVHQKEAHRSPVSVVILTHHASEGKLSAALRRIARHRAVKAKPVMMRIEELGASAS